MYRLVPAMAFKHTPILVILGATGAGKSQLALELAEKFGGEIISADAMQMYRGLDIVTNKVTLEEQNLVRHHMINILDPLSINNVVDFRNKALPVVEKLLVEGKIPVICGGTNYYIESLLFKVLVDEALPFIVEGKRSSSDDGDDRNIKYSKVESINPALEEDNSEVDMKTSRPNIVDNTEPVSIASIDWSEDQGSPSTKDLYSLLQTVDPDRASVLHPKERRKIWRSLQVFSQHGVSHSKLLNEQGGSKQLGLGGGLRFDKDRVCIIEVWSEPSVLDARCDKRVDKMLARGLVEELQQFHLEYNKLRAEKGDLETLDYNRGIWQSIGFKEFHKYLCLEEAEKESEEGKQLFSEGVERMKIATRQYSRRQMKWIRRRFLLDSRSPPPVYRVDSTDPTLWQEKVYQPAEIIVRDFIEGRRPEMEPLEKTVGGEDREEDCRKTLHCDVCNRDFKGSHQFKHHLLSASHRKVLRTTTDKCHYVMHLVEYKEGDRNGVARIIKNTFGIGLSETFAKMDTLPAELCAVVGETKATNIAKNMAKHGIVVDVEKIILEKANTSM